MISAQGGALTSFCRESELATYAGLPGLWRWRVAYHAPDRFGITMITDVGEQSYLTDGTTVRGYTDGALLVSEPLATSTLRTLVRWTAVTTLSALALEVSAITIEEAAASVWSAASSAGPAIRFLQLHWTEGGARYALAFDRDGRLLRASGPVEIPPIGSGQLEAEFSDYRRVGRYTLPFRIGYRLNGRALLDERVVRFVPNSDEPSGPRGACTSTR